MDGFTKVGRVEDFVNRRPKSLVLDDKDIVVLNLEGTIHAFENSCPHQHFSLLHQGVVGGCTITCPMHGWTFDVGSGHSTNGSGKLRKFETKVLDDRVWIRRGEENQEYSLFDRM